MPEAIETCRPQALVGPEPVLELAQRFGADLVNTPLTLDARPHQTCVAQGAQVFRCSGLAEPQALNQLSHRSRVIEQEPHDLQSMGFRERAKCWCQAGHPRYMP